MSFLRIVSSMWFVFLSTGCLFCVFKYIVVEGKCRGLDGSKRIWKSVRVVRTFRKSLDSVPYFPNLWRFRDSALNLKMTGVNRIVSDQFR